MNIKKQSKKFLDNTISYTTSSLAYKDPYRPIGWPGYHLYNRIYSFLSYRNIENEFVDFEALSAEQHY